MKLMALVLILISSLSTSAFPSFDLCHNQHADLQVENLICLNQEDQFSIGASEFDRSNFFVHVSETDGQKETDDSHKHCETQCSHHFHSIFSDGLTVIQFDLVQNFNSYKFTFLQAYLEGPFRPPLV